MAGEDKFEPRPVESYECVVCGEHKKKPEEARQCAMDDTRKVTIDTVVKDDEVGYPIVFVGLFRTGITRTYARVEKCDECKGMGERLKDAEGDQQVLFPCVACNGTGFVIRK